MSDESAGYRRGDLFARYTYAGPDERAPSAEALAFELGADGSELRLSTADLRWLVTAAQALLAHHQPPRAEGWEARRGGGG